MLFRSTLDSQMLNDQRDGAYGNGDADNSSDENQAAVSEYLLFKIHGRACGEPADLGESGTGQAQVHSAAVRCGMDAGVGIRQAETTLLRKHSDVPRGPSAS